MDANFLNVLGVRPALGSSFTTAEVQPGAPRTVILTAPVWRRRYASDPAVIGQTLTLDGSPARIVGVLPSRFELPTLEHCDLLVPETILPAGWQRGSTRVLRVIGRLNEGTTLDAARRGLQPFFNQILASVPPPFRKEVQFCVRTIRDRQMGDYSTAAWALFAAVLLVLVIGCANVGNLLLARMAGRRPEIAIRTAIGISRTRLAAQLLTESLLLAITGGALGCALAALLLKFVKSSPALSICHLAEASVDPRVLAFSLASTIVSGVLFGVVPLFGHTTELTTANRFTTPRSASFLKNTLLTTQVAASIVLLSSAGLLIRTFWNLESQPLGMRPDHVLTAQFVLPGSRFTKPEQRIGFFNRIEDQLHSIPRIEASGLSDSLPPAGWERSRPLFVLQVVGHPRAQAGTGGMVNWRYVSPGYFKTLQIPVIVGRAFSEQDRRPSVHLIMLSESLALRLFPAGDAVGQHLTIGSDVVYEVAGIVPDIKNSGLSLDPNPEYYILRTHSPDDTYLNSTGPVAQRTLSVLVRASLGREELAATLKQRLSALDPNLPVEIESMDERLNRLLSTPRLYVLLLCGFAFTGLSLASVGLYGTVSYLVVQRTKEIGIRVSLGATPASVSGIMLSYTAKWTLLGAAIGLTVAVTTSKILSSLLFGVSPHDPVTLAVSLCCLLIAAFIAVLAPTRRASAVDPIMALRNDT